MHLIAMSQNGSRPLVGIYYDVDGRVVILQHVNELKNGKASRNLQQNLVIQLSSVD